MTDRARRELIAPSDADRGVREPSSTPALAMLPPLDDAMRPVRRAPRALPVPDLAAANLPAPSPSTPSLPTPRAPAPPSTAVPAPPVAVPVAEPPPAAASPETTLLTGTITERVTAPPAPEATTGARAVPRQRRPSAWRPTALVEPPTVPPPPPPGTPSTDEAEPARPVDLDASPRDPELTVALDATPADTDTVPATPTDTTPTDTARDGAVPEPDVAAASTSATDDDAAADAEADSETITRPVPGALPQRPSTARRAVPAPPPAPRARSRWETDGGTMRRLLVGLRRLG